jgi:hypothetical protein
MVRDSPDHDGGDAAPQQKDDLEYHYQVGSLANV